LNTNTFTNSKLNLIALLPKSTKDVLSINNWRPLSLLNVDYKIAAKCIGNRVKKSNYKYYKRRTNRIH